MQNYSFCRLSIIKINTKNLLKSHVFMLQKNYWKSLIYIKSFKITAWQYKRWLVLYEKIQYFSLSIQNCFLYNFTLRWNFMKIRILLFTNISFYIIIFSRLLVRNRYLTILNYVPIRRKINWQDKEDQDSKWQEDSE